MIIKSYYAESAAAALKKVRQELGGEAIVLKTRQLPYGKPGHRFEITACSEQGTLTSGNPTRIANHASDTVSDESHTSPTDQPTITTATEIEASANQTLSALSKKMDALDKKLSQFTTSGTVGNTDTASLTSVRSCLERGDVPSSLIQELLAEVTSGSAKPDDTMTHMRNVLTARYLDHVKMTFTCKAGDRILVLGAPGAGKSSFLAKLAVMLFTEQKLAVTLASIDSQKLGAHEELATYADILNIPCADEPSDTVDITRYKKQVLLIDSPGIDLRPDTAATVRSGIARFRPTHRMLVVPATLRSGDAVDFARRSATFNPTHIGVTMCDLTRRFGGILAVAETCALPIIGFTDRPGGIGSLRTPDPAFFASGILPEGDIE